MGGWVGTVLRGEREGEIRQLCRDDRAPFWAAAIVGGSKVSSTKGLPRARRFLADKRVDGSVIEHPLYRDGIVRIQGDRSGAGGEGSRSKGGPKKTTKRKTKKKGR